MACICDKALLALHVPDHGLHCPRREQQHDEAEQEQYRSRRKATVPPGAPQLAEITAHIEKTEQGFVTALPAQEKIMLLAVPKESSGSRHTERANAERLQLLRPHAAEAHHRRQGCTLLFVLNRKIARRMRQFHFLFRTADSPRQGAAVIADEFERIHTVLIEREVAHPVDQHQNQHQNGKHGARRDQDKLPLQFSCHPRSPRLRHPAAGAQSCRRARPQSGDPPESRRASGEDTKYRETAAHRRSPRSRPRPAGKVPRPREAYSDSA